MNAFFRMGANEADYASYQNKEKGHAMMYAKATENDSIENYVCLRASDPSLDQLGVGSEFQQEDGTFVPNDMVSAVAYFDEGHYHNGIYVNGDIVFLCDDPQLIIKFDQEKHVTGVKVTIETGAIDDEHMRVIQNRANSKGKYLRRLGLKK